MWYVCDGCTHAIYENKFRFDCLQCDNFTFCDKCYKKNKTHPHKFQKAKVPRGEGPPDNSKDLISMSYMNCNDCGESLLDLSKRVFTCHDCTENFDQGQAKYWCLKCKETTKHEHKLSKLKGAAGNPFEGNVNKDSMNEEQRAAYLDDLFEEYHNLDYDDVIGGGTVLTRFKYTSVPQEDFGLSNEEILLLEDK